MSQGVGNRGQLRVFLRAKDHLGQAFPITQINENNAAMIAADVDPAGELDRATNVGGAQLGAVMGAIHGVEASLRRVPVLLPLQTRHVQSGKDVDNSAIVLDRYSGPPDQDMIRVWD